MSLAAVNQDTGRPAEVPPGVTAAADGAFTLAASDGTLIWNTNTGAIRGWNKQWGRSVTLLPSFVDWPLARRLQMSGAGYPRIHRQYIALYAGNTYVLDLKTNSFARLSTNGGVEDMSGPQLSVEQYTSGSAPTATHGQYRFSQTIVNLDRLPDLGRCP